MENKTNKPVAIILGGTFPHIELINNLKKRCYYTILIDYLDNPPAKEYADEHIIESTLNKDLVLQIAKKRNTELIISSCVDQANVTVCYVAEKLNLPHPYSYEIAKIISNKVSMKKHMVEGGIPTSNYVEVDNLTMLYNINLKYPLIVKPSDSNSSKGVRKADNSIELYEYAKHAFAISRNKKIIIEEYLDGKEIGVDCYIKNGDAKIIMTRERIKILDDNISTQQIYGSFWPAELTDDNLKSIKEIANKIASIFGLENTPLMIQAILKDDCISVIEFAPRIGGGENYRIIRELTNFDIIDASINSFLLIPQNIDFSIPNYIYFDNYIYTKPAVFNTIVGVNELIDNKLIEYVNVYKKKDTLVDSEMSSNNRVGVFTLKSNNRKDIINKLNKSIKTVDVLDINGNSIMIKNIYKSFFDEYN